MYFLKKTLIITFYYTDRKNNGIKRLLNSFFLNRLWNGNIIDRCVAAKATANVRRYVAAHIVFLNLLGVHQPVKTRAVMSSR